jgi:cation:H+ antiporter
MAKNIELENDIMETIYPLLLGSSFLLWFALSDYQFNWVETGIFLAGMILFLVYLTKDDEQQSVEKKPARVKDYVTILLSIIAIYFGANYTIDGLVKISSQLGVNPAVVSITVLALGTSLPEIVVCISASRRGLNSMAVGNIIGSNIFNTYAVMAVPSLFGNLNIPGRISDFSLPFMIVVTILFGVVCVNKRITIWEALMLLGFYIFFTAELIRLGFVN